MIEADGTPGQWYLHLFDSSQPDFDWSNEEVRAEFRRILRFWLDRGVDGFRVDVAHGLVKADGLPDYTPAGRRRLDGRRRGRRALLGPATACTRSTATGTASSPSTTATARCAPRRGCPTPEQTALWVRPDEMHQAFNFAYLETEWDAAALRDVIDESLARLRRRRRAEHLGALEPRRRAPRVAPRADRREPAGSRHRPDSPGKPIPERRPAPRARRDHGHARAARLGLPLPGRGARPARGHRPRRRGAPGPDLVPHRRRALRPRRLPRADPVDGDRARLRLQPDRRLLAAAARRVGDARARRAGRRRRLDALALPHAARRPSLRTTSARGRSSGSTATRRTSSHSATGM